jgi:hypothetical protein
MMDNRRTLFQFLEKARDFSLPQSVQMSSRVQTAPCLIADMGGLELELTNNFHPVPKLRTSGAITTLSLFIHCFIRDKLNFILTYIFRFGASFQVIQSNIHMHFPFFHAYYMHCSSDPPSLVHPHI